METGALNLSIAGTSVTAHYAITSEHTIRCNFSFRGKNHSMEIRTWSYRKFSDFLARFHEAHATPDEQRLYGSSVQDDEGFMDFKVWPDQSLNINIRALCDCIKYLSQLVEELDGKLLDYANWYIHQYHDRYNFDTYAKYIQYAMCKCIIEIQFSAPGVPPQVVNFLTTD
jgi:hypothetical protein